MSYRGLVGTCDSTDGFAEDVGTDGDLIGDTDIATGRWLGGQNLFNFLRDPRLRGWEVIGAKNLISIESEIIQ